MLIRDEKTLQETQNDFMALFPFLKIEFYSARHKAGEGSPVDDQLDLTMRIGDARRKKAEGEFRISPEMSAAELERLFSEKFGLNVQVFRRSGDIWLQTTTTDSWPLEEQNRKGERSTQSLYDNEE